MYEYQRREAMERMNQRRRALFGIDDRKEVETFENKEEQRYVAMMSSVSHTFGNVLAYVQQWVMDLFPDNLFKTVHVNSKIAHRQLRSTSYEMLKKSKPMIVFRPRIADVSEQTFLQHTMLTERMNNIYSSYDSGAYQPFFNDPKNHFSIKYQLNSSVMYVDIILIFATYMQQVDYWHFVRNAIPQDRPFPMETCLENFIPQDMLQVVSQLSGIPMYDPQGSIKPFLDYLNANSNSPITYKLQGSSGNKEFYRYYPTNINALMNDLSRDDGDRTGQVTDNYQVTFTLRLEFWTTGFYYLFSDHLFDMPLPEVYPESTDVIPVYTDVILREDLNLAFGWHLYNRASYRLETENDVVNIDELLNDSIREVIKYTRTNGLPLGEYIDLKIRRQGQMIVDGIDYSVNWETREITFYSQNTYLTYNIMVCVNIAEVNELIKDIFKLDKIKS